MMDVEDVRTRGLPISQSVREVERYGQQYGSGLLRKKVCAGNSPAHDGGCSVDAVLRAWFRLYALSKAG